MKTLKITDCHLETPLTRKDVQYRTLSNFVGRDLIRHPTANGPLCLSLTLASAFNGCQRLLGTSSCHLGGGQLRRDTDKVDV